MKKTMSKVAIAALFVAVPSIAAASGGIVGDCTDCHTMHNSEQGSPVAIAGGGSAGSSLASGPIANLLRMDCMACHAQNTTDRVVDMGGGSEIPQVYHQDTKDLAGGNFRYIDSMSDSRKGHNVIDLFAGGDNDNDTFGAPPGKYRPNTHGSKFSVSSTFDQFTCAGSVGCHGTRSQMLTGDTVGNITVNSYEYTKRTGMAAISGAHHASYDGVKNSAGYTTATVHSGAMVADGYRFIPGLKGYGNQLNRWENNAGDHNEYYGQAATFSGCGACHATGHGTSTNAGASSRMTFNSTLKVPNNSMSGFCATCHGMFHSSGTGSNDLGGNNGVSGAFLRHPSDFALPAEREYTGYQTYDPTAPVARTDISTLDGSNGDTGINAGDMVMCLSCHKAHGSENDYMLRVAYQHDESSPMEAGAYATILTAQSEGMCLACHTEKGVLPEDR